MFREPDTSIVPADAPFGEAYAHAILDAALDAVITIDHLGRVLEFNRAAERTFGFEKEDVLGHELAALVVPEQFRAAHRAALARWTEEGPGPGAGGLLGKRIEVEGMRADGSVFPAEIAITRVDVPGPPVFTACIRDISDRRNAEERLQQAEFRFRTLVEQLPLISYVDSADSAISKPEYLSPHIEAVLGFKPSEWMSSPGLYQRSIHADDREWVLAEKQAAYDRGEPSRLEYRMVAADGRVVWVEDRSVPIWPPDGSPSFRQGFAVDVTERKLAEAAVGRADARFRTLVEQLPLTVYIDRVDTESSNLYSSPQIVDLTGYSPEEWASDASLFMKALHPEDRERVREAHLRTHTTGEPMNVEYRLIHRDGRVVWVHDEARLLMDADGQNPVLQGYLFDVTDRKEAEGLLRHQAFHDALTGLPNRALFTDRVEHALVIRPESGQNVAVLFVDLDDFKAVNDTYGHPAGDELLHIVGRRLREAVPAQQTVARIGGDEFAILVAGQDAIAGAVTTADQILAKFHEPFEIEGGQVFVTPSIGIAVCDDADTLLRSANVAMYRAKSGGGDQCVVYAAAMDESVAGRLELVGDLRRASAEEDFVLHYQPTVDLASGGVVGLEALVRWEHPKRGQMTPAEFITLAEETGRIVDIGRWVLAEACRQVAVWRERLGSDSLEVSVNVSPRQVRRIGLVDDVRAALADSGLEPSALTLEITESVLAGQREDMIGILHEVTELGVALALDDFGTGYSSLSLLQDLPVDTLKIDRSFVATMGTSRERVAFVKAIVELAQALGVSVVGEGIETEIQAQLLLRLGCRIGQGYHFAGPLDAATIDRLIGGGRLPRLPGGGATHAEAA